MEDKPKIKIWYVMNASMLCGESDVQLYGSEAKARAEYDRLRAEAVKGKDEDDLKNEELWKENDVKGLTARYWMSGDINYDTDECVELHYQMVKVE